MPRLLVILLVLMSMVLSGCMTPESEELGRDYRGGGWIASAFPEESEAKGAKAKNAAAKVAKATFGFMLNGDTEVHEGVHGRFQYNDHGSSDEFPKGINIKGVVSDCACDDLGCEYYGTYQPKPRGEGGDFVVRVEDWGEGQELHGKVWVTLSEGDFGGYSNDGELGGGNVQEVE